MAKMSTFSRSAVSSITPFTFDLNFTPSINSFHFFVPCLSLWANSLLHFCKIQMGLSLGDKEASGDRLCCV